MINYDKFDLFEKLMLHDSARQRFFKVQMPALNSFFKILTRGSVNFVAVTYSNETLQLFVSIEGIINISLRVIFPNIPHTPYGAVMTMNGSFVLDFMCSVLIAPLSVYYQLPQKQSISKQNNREEHEYMNN